MNRLYNIIIPPSALQWGTLTKFWIDPWFDITLGFVLAMGRIAPILLEPKESQ